MIKRILFCIPFLICCLNLYGQIYSHEQLDNLEIQLEKEKGISRINTLLELSEGYNQFNLKTALNYAKQAAILSKKYGYDWGYYKSLYCGTKSAKENSPIYKYKPILKSCVFWFKQNGYAKDAFLANNIYIECVRQTERKENSQHLAIELLNEAEQLQDDDLLGKAWYGAARHELGTIDAYYTNALDSAKFYRRESSDSSNIVLTEIVRHKAGTKESFEAYYDAYEKALLWKNPKLKSQVARYLANGYAGISYEDSARHYIDVVLNEAENYGSSRVLATTYSQLGYSYWSLKDTTKMLDAFLVADSITDKLGYNAERIIVLRKLATSLIITGEYEKGIHYILKSIPLAELLEEHTEKIKLQLFLGLLYSNIFEYEKAEEVLIDNAQAINELPDTEHKIILKAQNNRSLGHVYGDLGQHEKALKIIEDELESLKGTNITEREIIYLEYDILEIYIHLEDVENAEKQLEVLLSHDKDLLNVPGFTPFNLAVGHLRILQKDYEEGVKLMNEYFKTTPLDEMNKNHKAAYELLCLAYKNLGQYKNAIEALESANRIEDNIKNQIKSQTLKIQSDYEIAQKEAEIEDLKKQQEIQDLQLIQESNTSRIRQQFNIIMGIVVVFILALGYFTFRRIRLKKEKNELLMKSKQIELELENIESKQKAELAEVKNTLFANISHEFRTPLTLIKVPVQIMMDRLPSEEKPLLDGILTNTDELLKMVDELLELAKITKGEFQLNESIFNLHHFFASIKTNFKSLFKEKKIDLHWANSLPNLSFNGDEYRLKIVLNNLLKNAYYHTAEGGKVTCKIAYSLKFGIQIEVTNTGKNIDSKDFPHLFDRYYRGSETEYTGNGIGLSLCKQIVDLHHGIIEVDNTIENSVTFRVELPQSRIIEEKELFIEPDAILPNEHASILKPNQNPNSHLPLLLIAEDNAEMRNLLATILQNEFRLLFAENGEVGEQMAIENQPDLIISDLMMPVKDGFELLNALKKNFETSHIPIILLTAKAGSDSRIQGLDQDADDYLVKPFNKEELKSRIFNLLRQRKKLQKLYLENPLRFIKRDNLISKLDSEFLEKVQSILESNYSNGDFTVNEFCKELALNRNSVHIKIKNYTGKGTGEYIRNYRLSRALTMLMESRMSIADISIACGFNSSQAFNQIFKKEFEVTPGQYRKNNS